jgi:DNA-binding GntR family transcriptional regulator
MAEAIEPLPRRLLRDEAYTRIRAAIIDGELAPGEVVRDLDLAHKLGLSRTPVREALSRLTDEGLVESKPHAYTRVTPLLREATYDAFQVVSSMHHLAVRLAVPRITRDHVSTLNAINKGFSLALDRHDVAAAVAADDAFHGLFIEVAGNRALADTIDRYTPLIRRLERLRFSSLPARRSIRIHADLAKAAASGDVERAAQLSDQIWATLGNEIDRAFAEPHQQSPNTEGAPR